MFEALAISSMIISLFAVILAGYTTILFLAKEKSQHVVQFVPADDLVPGKREEPMNPYVEFDDPVMKSIVESNKKVHKPRAVQ